MAILKDNLISFWELEEVSGTRVDAVTDSANNLTDNNTVTQNPGKVGSAAQFTNVNSEFLSRASNDSLNMGDIDFTIALWVYLTSKTPFPAILSKIDSGATGYSIYYTSGGDRFGFAIDPTGSGRVDIVANNFGSPSITTWYFLVAQYDAAADLAYISINNGAQDSSSVAGGALANTRDFCIGNEAGGVDTDGMLNGRIDQVGVWKRKLDANELARLYNTGVGLSFAQMTTGIVMRSYRPRPFAPGIAR